MRTRIERALWEIDGATFQRLGDAYLRRRGYSHIIPIGIAIARQKTTTGTPDTLVVRDDGKYVFVEYTTQEHGVAAKFHGDLLKCFDQDETGVPVSRIAEVVLCYNGKLQAAEELGLRLVCEKKGVHLTTIGIGELAADIAEKYPSLAHEFLGLDADSGQILSPEDFVKAYGASALATPLNTIFQFRENEVDAALKGLESSSVVLLSGRPGSGKSRLALEIARKYTEKNPLTQTWCILNRRVDLFRELRAKFAEPGHYLLIVDDANRLSSFQYVLDLLQDSSLTRTMRVIATVRDYALDIVRDAAAPFGAAAPIEIGPMSTEQIYALVAQVHGIVNHLYLERIALIAEGNPRLALMAASLAVKEDVFSSLHDVTALYEEYFASMKRDMDALGDPKVILVAGIVAFFRSVDRNHAEQMGIIGDTFGVASKTFWETVQRLHELEICDLYADEVVRISDQVMATYLFYVAAFRDKSLDLSSLLISGFPRFRQRFVDALNPVMSTFNSAAVNAALKPHILRALETFTARGDEASKVQLIDTFAPLIAEKAFALVYETIDKLNVESESVAQISFVASSEAEKTDSILSILSHFHHSDDSERRIAIELVLAYLRKRFNVAARVVRMLTEEFGINHRSYAEGFVIQAQVLELLNSASEGGEDSLIARLHLAVAAHYLRTSFHYLEPIRGMAFNSINYFLVEDPALRALRNRAWGAVFSLARIPAREHEAIQVLRNYTAERFNAESRSVLEKDAERLVPYLMAELKPGVVLHALIVREYVEATSRLGIALDPALEKRFATKSIELYELLTGDKSERRKIGSEEYREIRKERFDRYSKDLNVERIATFLDDVEQMLPALSEHDVWLAGTSITELLQRAVMTNPRIFVETLVPRLRAGEVLKLEPYGVIPALVSSLGADGALEVLTQSDFPRRWFWLLYYCSSLPLAGIGRKQVEILLEGYRNAPGIDVPLGLDHLLLYREVDSTVPLEVAQILEQRLAKEVVFASLAASFFGKIGELGRKLDDIFETNIPLAKRLYIAVASRVHAFDYDAMSFDMLLNLDQTFAREWVQWAYTKADWRHRHDDLRDYSRLWLRPDYSDVLSRLYAGVKEDSKGTISIEPYLVVFFRVPTERGDKTDIWTRQDAWLAEMISAYCDQSEDLQLLFGVVGELPSDRRLTHIESLLACNQDFGLFRSLQLEPTTQGCTGSAVPMYEAQIDYYNSILSFCNSIPLLEHRQHVKTHIEQLEHIVEHLKKDDFMND